MSSSVSSFVSKLEKINKSKELSVYLPSRKKEVSIRPLNLKQQKDLISSVLDGLQGSIDFNKTLNEIILENTSDSDLKIYDKIPFIISIRKDALGNKINVDETVIDLERVLNNIKNIEFDLKDEEIVTYEGISITLRIPTLRQELILLKKCEQDISNREEDNNFKQDVGTLYMFEIIKFIKSISIEGEELDLSEIRISERIKLVEKLPLSLYSKISSFIEAVNDYNNKLMVVDDYEITITSEFFDKMD